MKSKAMPGTIHAPLLGHSGHGNYTHSQSPTRKALVRFFTVLSWSCLEPLWLKAQGLRG